DNRGNWYSWHPSSRQPWTNQDSRTRSMPQQEFLAVQDRPAGVFPRLAAVACAGEMPENGIPLAIPRLAAERGDGHLLADPLIRRAQLQASANPIVVSLKCVAHRVAIDELERLRQRRRFRPLALACQQSVGLTERLEEFPPHPRAGELHGVCAWRSVGEGFSLAERLADGVQQNLGREQPHRGAGEVG